MKDEFLYCIEHEQMAPTFTSPYAPVSHEFWTPVPDSDMSKLEYCDFLGGWAVMPPPPFDMDEFMDGAQEEVSEDFLPYAYDEDRDEIVQELLS